MRSVSGSFEEQNREAGELEELGMHFVTFHTTNNLYNKQLVTLPWKFV